MVKFVKRLAYLTVALAFALGPLCVLQTPAMPRRSAVAEQDGPTSTVVTKSVPSSLQTVPSQKPSLPTEEPDLIHPEPPRVTLPIGDTPIQEKRPPPTSLEDDPRLDLARQARNMIESRERALAQRQEQLFRVLDEAIARIPSDDLAQEQLAFTTMRQISRVLRGAAEDILVEREEYLASARALRDVKQASIPVFKQAEQAYRDYAKAEQYESISHDYLLLADTFSLFAKNLQRQAEQEAPDHEEWSDTLDYIARTAIFLERLERTLSILAPLDSATRQAEYSDQLRSYVRYYEKLRDSFKDFHARLTSQALAPDLRSTTTSSK